jgi:hypothetical protein
MSSTRLSAAKSLARSPVELAPDGVAEKSMLLDSISMPRKSQKEDGAQKYIPDYKGHRTGS